MLSKIWDLNNEMSPARAVANKAAKTKKIVEVEERIIV
jgi:hypothetical protein